MIPLAEAEFITEVAAVEPGSPPQSAEEQPAAKVASVEEVVVKHLRQRCSMPIVPEGPPRRGVEQRRQREQEQQARRHAVAVSERVVADGWSWSETARLLNVAERTLRQWRQRQRQDERAACPLGRPLLIVPRVERNEVIRFLDEFGPGVGVPCLRASFPALPRAVLADLLQRYRRVWRRRHREPLRVLHWTMPGRVWALDFTGPLPALDGLYPYLLAVRDLASGQQLLWLPLREATSVEVVPALASLFVVQGAPLVLKSDNGSAFGTAGVQQLLQEFGVECLFSPPHMPRYNGGIEAGIGALQARTEQQAARHGRPGHWTWDDAEAARREANATSRPRGEHGPCPDELWTSRTRISPVEHERFAAAVRQLRAEQSAAQGRPIDHPEDVMGRRATERDILRRTLEHLDYLRYTRRRILRPIRRKKVAGIP